MEKLPFAILPRSAHSSNDFLRPKIFSPIYLYFSVRPLIRIQAKSEVGGSATHDARCVPKGRSGPFTHFCSFRSKISVVFEQYSAYVSPPAMMIDFVDPSSDWRAQLEWFHLASSNGGPSVQLLSFES